MAPIDEIQAAKRALRREAMRALRTMTADQRREGSARACARLRAQPEWRHAASVLLFAPMAEELDVWPLVEEALAEGKAVALPRFDARAGVYRAWQVNDLARDLAPGHFGIREPGAHCAEFPGKGLDLILVPGLAYDLQGRRLGRGKGYYDRLLPTLGGVACGVAFDQQIVSAIPVDTHDVQVNLILTPGRWHAVCGGRSALE